MHYLTDHWSFDPFIIVVAILVVWHEIGLARLARRSRPDRTRERRRRSWLFYGGVGGVVLTAPPPLPLLGERPFLLPLIQHPPLVFSPPRAPVGGRPA